MQSKRSRYLLILVAMATLELTPGARTCNAQFFFFGRKADKPTSVANRTAPNTSCDLNGCPPYFKTYGVYHESWRPWPQALSEYSTDPSLSPFVSPEKTPSTELPEVEIPDAIDETSVAPRKRSALGIVDSGPSTEIIPSAPRTDNVDPMDELTEELPGDIVPDEGGDSGFDSPDIDTLPEAGPNNDVFDNLDSGPTDRTPTDELPGIDDGLPPTDEEDELFDFDDLGRDDSGGQRRRNSRISLNNKQRRFSDTAHETPINHDVITASNTAPESATMELKKNSNPLRKKAPQVASQTRLAVHHEQLDEAEAIRQVGAESLSDEQDFEPHYDSRFDGSRYESPRYDDRYSDRRADDDFAHRPYRRADRRGDDRRGDDRRIDDRRIDDRDDDRRLDDRRFDDRRIDVRRRDDRQFDDQRSYRAEDDYRLESSGRWNAPDRHESEIRSRDQRDYQRDSDDQRTERSEPQRRESDERYSKARYSNARYSNDRYSSERRSNDWYPNEKNRGRDLGSGDDVRNDRDRNDYVRDDRARASRVRGRVQTFPIKEVNEPTSTTNDEPIRSTQTKATDTSTALAAVSTPSDDNPLRSK